MIGEYIDRETGERHGEIEMKGNCTVLKLRQYNTLEIEREGERVVEICIRIALMCLVLHSSPAARLFTWF